VLQNTAGFSTPVTFLTCNLEVLDFLQCFHALILTNSSFAFTRYITRRYLSSPADRASSNEQTNIR